MRVAILAIALALTGCVSQSQPGGIGGDDFDMQEAAKTRISLGLTYLKNNNYKAAKMNLDKALEFAPRLADTHYSLAYYYQLVGETARAEEAYGNAMSLAPRNADIANSYGAFLCQQGRYDDAMTYFSKAVENKQYANSAETYENMALCASEAGRTDDAKAFLENALNHQPGRAKSLMLLTELYMSRSQWDEAEATLRRYQKVTRVTPDSLWMAMEIARGRGDAETAKGYGDMLLTMYPGNPLAKRYRENKDSLFHSPPVVKVKKKSASDSAVSPEPTLAVATPEVQPDADVGEPEIEAASDESESDNTATKLANDDKNVVNDATLGDAEGEEEVADSADMRSNEVTQNVVSQKEVATTSSDAGADAGIDTTDEPSQDGDMERFHIVQKGENMYRISLKYNIKMDKLQEWNNLSQPGAIFAGMKLWLVEPSQQDK